jgi:hypothetical protein
VQLAAASLAGAEQGAAVGAAVVALTEGQGLAGLLRPTCGVLPHLFRARCEEPGAAAVGSVTAASPIADHRFHSRPA